MSRKKSNGTRAGDPPKTPKVWEKARREKMKIYFNELHEVLPLYDPSAPMSRFEILQKSRSYIKELQSQNQDLLNGGFDEVYKSKMEKLKQRVKELLQRVDQLTDLLRRANIMIPPLVPCPDKQESLSLSQKWMNQRPKKWTEKINVVVPDEKIENILSLIKDFKKKSNSGKKSCKNYEKASDNKGPNIATIKKASFTERIELKKKRQLKKMKTSKITKVPDSNCDKSDKGNSHNFSDSQSPSHAKENQPVDFNLPINEESPGVSNENNVSNKTSQESPDLCEKDGGEKSKTLVNNDKISIVSGKVKNLIEPQSNVFLPANTNVVQSNTFLLTNDGNLVQFPLLNSSGNVFGANTNLLTQTAIVNQPNTGLLTPLVINRPSPVIVLQKPAPQIQIVNPTPQILSMPNQNIQILGNSLVCPTSSQTTKTLPYILSKQPPNKKRIAKDSTVTTFVNKIPIPALSKQSYVKKSVGLSNCISVKGKSSGTKSKEGKDKSSDSEKTILNESEGEVQSYEKEIQTEKITDESLGDRKITENDEGKENETETSVDDGSLQKRTPEDDQAGNSKKQKISGELSEENVFKPIENPILADPRVTNDGLFCNLKLPSSMGNNLSVSPTAAFLSTFPIVASSKFEDELAGKIDDRREDKDPKIIEEKSKEKEIPSPEIAANKTCKVTVGNKEGLQPATATTTTTTTTNKDDENEKTIVDKTTYDMNIVGSSLSATTNESVSNSNVSDDSNKNNLDNNVIHSNINQCSQLIVVSKSWDEYQQPKNCEVRADPFYIHSDLQNPVPPPVLPEIPNASMPSFPEPNPIYKNYQQNNMKTSFNIQMTDQMTVKNNQFDYGQKENFQAKRMNYNAERNSVKKPCSNAANDTYTMAKNQLPMYQTEQPNYQLVPVKEMPNQRNSRPPVNWMTDPDVRTRTMSYGSTGAAAAAPAVPSTKIPPFTQPDIFYGNNQKSQPDANDFILTDINKSNYQKNDFYVNKSVEVQMKVPDQRCKNVEKRSDGKFTAKLPNQNSYNIFDYNYNGNYFGEEESNKFCNGQTFQSNGLKAKKTNTGMGKKKTENPVQVSNGIQQSNDSVKRNSDQIISNLDFNPVGNQECFSWVPGKNVEWLPSKSFVDTNLILPSTLPTLVGDLALGTTTSNEVAQTKGNRGNQSKTGLESTGKSYMDLGLVNTENTNKQYLEPFTNLSKNIFDLTPSNNVQNTQLLKNDCEKNGYVGNVNETIVLKNIFELPVSKSFGNDFSNRNKQRTVNNTQNNFLSVSQLVETPNYESNSIKSETSMEKQQESYGQNYSNYHGKQYKNKNRNSHYKYNDRKFHGYKNVSSNYTAEALIRSNANLSYQGNDYQSEVNGNFYAGKNPQKPENFANGNEPIPKTDFVPCSTQNIYSEFNFSSPVPNFNISTSVSADYVSHDGNFTAQNNAAFFGDFIPPEYPITESVSNSLLLPPCSIGLQNPFIIEKRNATPDKGKQGKHFSNSKSRKNFDCSKSYSDFSTSSGIFTNASITCPTIFTTTTCQNLLPVPNQNIPDANITFSASSFTSSNITFPPLTSNSNSNYHRSTTQNATATAFFPSSCPSMFTTCSTTTVSSSRTCLSTIPPTSSSNAVITTPFSVSNAPFPSSTQSTLPFLSLSNPIIPPSVPSTSGTTLANFNLSTIFPEINQKGNYHYP